MPILGMFTVQFSAMPEEARASMTGDMIKTATDPEFKATKEAEMNVKFANCDADGDGKHNRDEMKAMSSMNNMELKKSMGVNSSGLMNRLTQSTQFTTLILKEKELQEKTTTRLV